MNPINGYLVPASSPGVVLFTPNPETLPPGQPIPSRPPKDSPDFPQSPYDPRSLWQGKDPPGDVGIWWRMASDGGGGDDAGGCGRVDGQDAVMDRRGPIRRREAAETSQYGGLTAATHPWPSAARAAEFGDTPMGGTGAAWPTPAEVTRHSPNRLTRRRKQVQKDSREPQLCPFSHIIGGPDMEQALEPTTSCLIDDDEHERSAVPHFGRLWPLALAARMDRYIRSWFMLVSSISSTHMRVRGPCANPAANRRPLKRENEDAEVDPEEQETPNRWEYYWRLQLQFCLSLATHQSTCTATPFPLFEI
ncbi:hypothetical protein CPLU01_14045 [Colletotrichum plurivorum]|uniref:Uncharacterized protein n=1 Tax=Colletotrichum plurivorum TaxID=2175906 RepID=A0A8H6JMA6_9PEZI|nr:hypothetical protein CPLU01_14045 [Colletotrichum plurivorum]